MIKKDINKTVPSVQTAINEVKPTSPKDKIENVEEKNVQIEEKTVKVEPRKNKLNDLFSNTSDKTGKINKVNFIQIICRLRRKNELSF